MGQGECENLFLCLEADGVKTQTATKGGTGSSEAHTVLIAAGQRARKTHSASGTLDAVLPDNVLFTQMLQSPLDFIGVGLGTVGLHHPTLTLLKRGAVHTGRSHSVIKLCLQTRAAAAAGPPQRRAMAAARSTARRIALPAMEDGC